MRLIRIMLLSCVGLLVAVLALVNSCPKSTDLPPYTPEQRRENLIRSCRQIVEDDEAAGNTEGERYESAKRILCETGRE
jgi:hypothetical protein